MIPDKFASLVLARAKAWHNLPSKQRLAQKLAQILTQQLG
jgi:hypothetical protein